MLFSTLGLSVLALVGSVAAVPRSRANAPRNRPQNQFRQLAARDVNSNDWCGPIKHGSNITSVEGSWIVPSAKIPSGGSSSEEYWVYQWVGIDGVGDCTVLLQGGTGQTIINDKLDIFFWYEFYPAPPVITNQKISVGDEVFIKVDATSGTTGTVYIENRSTRESNSYNLSTKAGTLCLATAEWIVEDPGETPGPFPAWSSYPFTGCKGSTGDGTQIDLKGSELWYMTSKGAQICHAIIDSDTQTTFYNS